MANAAWSEWIERTRAANDGEELLRIRKDASDALIDRIAPGEVELAVHLLNRLHDAIISRICRLCERELSEEGFGLPPLPFSVVLFGSGGREEQTFWSDQDNGLIIGRPEGGLDDSQSRYFAAYGERLVERLVQAGYPPCEGKVTADQPDWRRTLEGWRTQLQVWLARGDWDSIRHVLIVSDMRYVYGDPAFVDELRDWLFGQVRDREELALAMLRNTLHHQVTVNAFGHPVKIRYGEDAGGVEVKYGAYLPLVNGIRLLALRIGCGASSTLGRLTGIREAAMLDEATVESWRTAVRHALWFRLLSRVEETGSLRSGGIIPSERIDRELTEALKMCLKTGARMQKLLPKLMRHGTEGRL